MVSLLETILFRFDSDTLRAAGKERLDKLVSGIPKDGSVRVTGYTCSIGPETYNQNLSARRAKAVAEYLEKQGVAVTHVEGRGECCPVDTQNKRQNRRVEIKGKKGKN